ncbi:acyltransferase family protein [Methylobacterium oryzisoli]|uniref:acyltransferase family protein n=1 Tax=Methylobacterium oryzisoli TaxID=3385502 RepID=UPI003891A60D
MSVAPIRNEQPTTSAATDAATAGAIPAILQGSHIPGLDGVRALSILIVLAGHYGFGRVVPGGLGVTIFFFLSGFLITTLLLREQRRTGGIDLRNFYIRRALRLTPEMAAFVLIIAAIAWYQGFLVRPVELLAALFYFTNYYHLTVGMCGYDACAGWHMLWSLAVEEHFYLVFPLTLILIGPRPRLLLAVLSGVLVFGLAWRLVVVLGLSLHPDWTYKASDARLDSIAYGCWLAVVFCRFPERLRWAWPHGRALFAAAAGLLLLSLSLRNPAFRDTARYSVQGLALTLGFVALYGSEAGGFVRDALERPALVWLGRLSYGTYLWHFVPLDLGLNLVGVRQAALLPLHLKLVVAPLAGLASVGLAYLSYRLIAQPAAGLRHRFGPRRRPVPAAFHPAARDAAPEGAMSPAAGRS